jgi:hypothetical protein
MKVRLHKDEWYPVYDFSKSGIEVEVPPLTVRRWKRAHKLFLKVQGEMHWALKENRTGA